MWSKHRTQEGAEHRWEPEHLGGWSVIHTGCVVHINVGRVGKIDIIRFISIPLFGVDLGLEQTGQLVIGTGSASLLSNTVGGVQIGWSSTISCCTNSGYSEPYRDLRVKVKALKRFSTFFPPSSWANSSVHTVDCKETCLHMSSVLTHLKVASLFGVLPHACHILLCCGEDSCYCSSLLSKTLDPIHFD